MLPAIILVVVGGFLTRMVAVYLGLKSLLFAHMPTGRRAGATMGGLPAEAMDVDPTA